MPLPREVSSGERLSALWLNQLRGEVQQNTIVSSKGLSFNRSTGGTSLSSKSFYGSIPFNGEIVDVINASGSDMEQWWFAGVEEVSNRDRMFENVYKGAALIVRKAEQTDLASRLVMLAEPIPYNSAGKAYIRSDMMITRISFASDGTEDEYRYATLDTTVAAGEEGAYLLQAAQIGPIQILDVEPDTTFHPSEPDWRWCIIRFPTMSGLIARFAEATSNPANGELTVKLAESDGTLVGDDITVYDGGVA